MRNFVILLFGCILFFAGCSHDLSRADALDQIMASTPVRMGASVEGRHIGSVKNLDIMEIFTDGPRARVKFAYGINIDKASDAAFLNEGTKVSVGIDNLEIFPHTGDFMGFGAATFERTDNGWTMRKISMDSIK